MTEKIDLDKLRGKLRILEDTIIHALFERTHFKRNKKMYIPGGIEIPDFKGSFLDYMLYGTECLHAKAGRYLFPDERAFFDNLPEPIISRSVEGSPLRSVNINVNDRIKSMYLDALSSICEKGNDGQFGDSAVWDIACLQALSKRVHYGTYVAESKYQQDSEGFSKLIQARDVEAIIEKLRDEEVEKQVLARVREKGERYYINPNFIKAFYRDNIIPLTIDVEVEYLMRRGTD